MKRLKALLVTIAVVLQSFSALTFAASAEQLIDGWTTEKVGDFGDTKVGATVSDTAYSGNGALSVINELVAEVSNTYFEVSGSLSSAVSEGSYKLEYYVSKHRKAVDPAVFLGEQEITLTQGSSDKSGWDKYTATIAYTGADTTSLKFRFYYKSYTYIIDDISLTSASGTENLVANPGFEASKPVVPDEGGGNTGEGGEGEDGGDTGDTGTTDTKKYPSVKTELTKYQPSILLLSPIGSAYVVNWRNPSATTLTKVSLYSVANGEEELLSDEFSTTPSASVYYKITGLTSTKNYQYKLVFSFSDMNDYTYFIGDNLKDVDQTFGAWTFIRVKNKGVGYSPTNFELDTSCAKDGSVSAKISSNVDKTVENFDECYLRINHTVSDMELTAGNKYLLSFWIKGQNVSSNIQAHMSWSMFSDGNAQVNNSNGTYDWKYVERTYVCPESNPKNLLVLLADGYAEGVWIDDVQMYKIENGKPVGKNLIQNGSFEDILSADLSEITKVNAQSGVGSVKLSWTADKNYNGANIYCAVGDHYEWRGSVSADVKEIEINNLYQDADYTYLIAPINSEKIEGEATKVTFRTLYEDYTVKQPVLEKDGKKAADVSEGGNYSLTVSAKNNTLEKDLDVIVIAAVYDENNIMTAIYSDSAAVKKSDVNAKYDDIKIENMSIPAGSTMQVYVMDSITSAERFYETVYY